MMFEPEIESRSWPEQRLIDDRLYLRQIEYLFANSRFYREKLTLAGFASARSVGGLAGMADLPFTEKDELRASRSEADPIGIHFAVPMEQVTRIFSTSGTTGTPSYIPLTIEDLDNWVRTSARSYAASGILAGQQIVSTYNAGPFVAGAALEAFNRLRLCHIPVGSGNTERLMAAVRLLKPQVLALTPSYALHVAEWAESRGIDPRATSIERLLVAGEPGGGEPSMRRTIENYWDASVTEAMGIGDISVSLWGECEEQSGMHFSGQGFVHFELVDPGSGHSVPIADGARGELVLTHLKHRAAPLLRFRTRDHVQIWNKPCACGRTSPRVRCIGRTDDMLIVRGVNVFPSALREVINQFTPHVSGTIRIRPRAMGVRQEPPLPIEVELARQGDATVGSTGDLAETIKKKIRETLLVTTSIDLVPWGTLPRSEYKSKLVDRTGSNPD